MSIISNILSIVDKLLPTQAKRRDKRILKENKKLRDAIERGDVVEIERIRNRKKHYGKLFVATLALFFMGCKTNIPIVGDMVPVRLMIGSQVILEDGSTNNVVEHKNTLVSDAYIFQSITSLDTKKPTK